MPFMIDSGSQKDNIPELHIPFCSVDSFYLIESYIGWQFGSIT